jgi:hypothetical protein
MTSLYYFALACSGWLSLIFLITSITHVLSVSITLNYDSDIIYNMPVITRSQSKAVSNTEVLLTTSSTNYHDPILSGLENSSTTTPLSTQPTQNESSSAISNTSVPRDLFDSLNICNVLNVVGNSSLFPTVPFQNYQSNDFDFEIPNFSTCQLLKPNTFEIISKKYYSNTTP